MRIIALFIVFFTVVSPAFGLASSSSQAAAATIRLNKVFKATHSRRQADDLIASGRVTINGEPVESAGCRVIPFKDIVCLDGQIIEGWEALNSCTPPSTSKTTSDKTTTTKTTTTVHEYIKYWKPCGITCTTDRSIPSNIIDQLEQVDGYQPKQRVYPVGRLDKDTSGLILLTSDGRLPNSALRGQYKQPKTYEVVVDQFISDQQIQRLRDGVVITTVAQRDKKRAPPLTAKTKPAQVERIRRRKVRMTIMEGRNRQIRKMVGALGLTVVELFRCQFMTIQLYPLQQAGDWAPLSKKEMQLVSKVISLAEEKSSTTTTTERGRNKGTKN